MSLQSGDRTNALIKERDSIKTKPAQAVSTLITQTNIVKLFIVFMHDNLLNNKGDMSEGDRLDMRDALVPLYPQLQAVLADITALFEIHDDDPIVWQANLDSYLLDNPTVLNEALSRFPQVV